MLKFGSKMTVSAFKSKHNVDKLDVVRNPNTNKLFVTAGGATVASVSKNYDSSKDKEFVELNITDDTTGAVTSMWCLHNPSNGNVEETL